jgi:hypothetical protein
MGVNFVPAHYKYEDYNMEIKVNIYLQFWKDIRYTALDLATLVPETFDMEDLYLTLNHKVPSKFENC